MVVSASGWRAWRGWLLDHPSGVVAAGFTAVLILMAVLIGLVFSRVQLLRDSLDKVVIEHNLHTAQAIRMQDIARRRIQMLQSIVYENDDFAREEQLQRYHALAAEFADARLRILSKPLEPHERKALDDLSVAVSTTRPIQDQVIDYAQSGDLQTARQLLFSTAIPSQVGVYDALSRLLQAQQVEVVEYHQLAARQEREARWLLLIGGGLSLVLSAILAWFAFARMRGLVATIRRHAETLEQAVVERTADVRDRETVMRQMTAAANDAVVMIDNHDAVTFWNPAAEKIFGYAESEALGRRLHDLIMPERYRERMAPAFALFTETGKGEFVGQTREVIGLRRDGSEFPAELSLSAVQIKGNWHAIGLARDISDRKRTERTLQEMATTDALTGIANRRKFDQLLENEIKRATRYQLPLTLVLFDIDHFKRVNDTYGHLAGDRVLTEIARLVTEHIRVNDFLARWGGEEFALLATHSDETLTGYLCEKLCALIAVHSFPVVGNITCSFGVSGLRPEDLPGSLVTRADEALYRAKSLGRNRVCQASASQ